MANEFKTYVIIDTYPQNNRDTIYDILSQYERGSYYNVTYMEKRAAYKIYMEIIGYNEPGVSKIQEIADVFFVDFYFISTDEISTFVTNDYDGHYFDDLYFVDAVLPNGEEVRASVSSTYELIDDISHRMNTSFSDLDVALKCINNLCEEEAIKQNAPEKYFYHIYEFKMVEFDGEDWVERID